MGRHRSTLARLAYRDGRAWLKAGIAAASTLALLTVAFGTIRPTAASYAAAPPKGSTLTWRDDFNGGAGIWKYNTGPGSNFGTGEIETVTTSVANVFHDGSGHLALRALHKGGNPDTGWTSGRIQTEATFGANPGGVVRIEASIQQAQLNTANAAGYWPAFWMLGSPLRTGMSWPTSGEVDIMESVNGRASVFGTLHCGVHPAGPCNEPSGISSGELDCASCRTGFHTYAVEIDRSISPEQIRWYLDGSNYFTVKADTIDAAAWAKAVDHPFFVILGLAIGGGFPSALGGGPTAATASGGEMKVDYVAVYNKS